MTWYFKPLGDGMWADVPSAEIKQLFQPLFESAGRPAEMAVFTRHEEGDLHCEWFAYFSPAAEAVAQKMQASPCNKPAREGLNLLAGDDKSWAALFDV
ncbi:MAG: hypothetical protein IT314_05705 [Anaerolineales bacterium]|nr:hypothetical protein [Anaerolineales bacterium]